MCLSLPQRKHSVPDGVNLTVKPGNLSRQVMHRDICKDAISEWSSIGPFAGEVQIGLKWLD